MNLAGDKNIYMSVRVYIFYMYRTAPSFNIAIFYFEKLP